MVRGSKVLSAGFCFLAAAACDQKPESRPAILNPGTFEPLNPGTLNPEPQIMI
jgi:hypothetical protein